MTPFTNTVSFINGDTGKFALRVDDTEDFAEMVECTVFWGYV